MQLSHYLKAWPCSEQPGYHLLFSTKKASLALVPDEIWEQLNQGDVSPEYKDTLTELDMLVPDRKQEWHEMLGYLDEVNRLNDGLDVSIILGLDCNFACTYCYEGSMKGKHTMSDDTADQLIAYSKSRFTPDKKKLTLDFYGGEPLLYTKRIKYIAKRLKPYVEEQGGTFRFSLVTNGSLLTPEIVNELLPLGLKAAKVTVDGPAAVHDQYRPFVSGKGSFAIIMRNVQACCDMVRIGLGGNFTRDNYKKMVPLLDYLEEQGLTPDRLANVQFLPAGQTTDIFANPEFSGGCVSCSEPWMAEASLLLREEVMKRGYKTPKMGPSPCMVDIDDGLVIHYDGSIFKCVAMIGHHRFAIGDVWKGIEDYRELYGLESWRKNKECRQCVYLPLCFGGCRDMEFQRSGSMQKVDCWRDFYDAILEKTVMQDVRYRYRPA
jgi:uncharacterized protein